MKLSGLGLFLVVRFFITDSITLLDIALFQFSSSSWFSFGRLCVLGICPFYLAYSRQAVEMFVLLYLPLSLFTLLTPLAPPLPHNILVPNPDFFQREYHSFLTLQRFLCSKGSSRPDGCGTGREGTSRGHQCWIPQTHLDGTCVSLTSMWELQPDPTALGSRS